MKRNTLLSVAIAVLFSVSLYGCGSTDKPVFIQNAGDVNTPTQAINIGWHDSFADTFNSGSGYIPMAAGVAVPAPPTPVSVATCGSFQNQSPGTWTCGNTYTDETASFNAGTRRLSVSYNGNLEYFYLLNLVVGQTANQGRHVVLGVESALNGVGVTNLTNICVYDSAGNPAPSPTTGDVPYVAFRGHMDATSGNVAIENYPTGQNTECDKVAFPVTFEVRGPGTYTLGTTVPVTAVTSYGQTATGTWPIATNITVLNGSGNGKVDFFHSIVEGIPVQYGALYMKPIPPDPGYLLLAEVWAYVHDPATGNVIGTTQLVNWEWSNTILGAQQPVFVFWLDASGNVVQGPDNWTWLFGNPL